MAARGKETMRCLSKYLYALALGGFLAVGCGGSAENGSGGEGGNAASLFLSTPHAEQDRFYIAAGLVTQNEQVGREEQDSTGRSEKGEAHSKRREMIAPGAPQR